MMGPTSDHKWVGLYLHIYSPLKGFFFFLTQSREPGPRESPHMGRQPSPHKQKEGSHKWERSPHKQDKRPFLLPHKAGLGS